MEANVCYKIKRQNYQGNSGPEAGVILKGETVSLTAYGSQSRPTAIADMVDIANSTTFDAEGAYTFSILPQYVCFYGTATSIELVNYEVVESLGSFGD